MGVLLGTPLPNPSGITGVMLCYVLCYNPSTLQPSTFSTDLTLFYPAEVDPVRYIFLFVILIGRASRLHEMRT